MISRRTDQQAWRITALAMAVATSLFAGCSSPATTAKPIDAGGATSLDAVQDGEGDAGDAGSDATAGDTFGDPDDGAHDGAAADTLSDAAMAGDAPVAGDVGDPVDADIGDVASPDDTAENPDSIGPLPDTGLDTGADAAAAGGDGSVQDGGTTGAADGATNTGGDSGPDGDSGTDANTPSVPALPLSALSKCDAGDVAWVIRALGFLRGRRPHGSAELSALVSVVGAVGRPAAAQAMMSGGGFKARWTHWLMDELRVARSGSRANRPCFGTPYNAAGSKALAQWLRNSDPATAQWTSTFNMADVIQSALELDDISVAYETMLFSRLSRPATRCDNPSIKGVERGIRRAFATSFREVYLHRGTACMGCHNSVYSTTDGLTPDTDRFWPLPGRFEKALFGKDAGLPDDVLDGPHRYYGFAEGGFCPQPAYCSVVVGAKVSPWNILKACAVVSTPAAVGKDMYGPSSYWVTPMTDTASTWELFASLRKGLGTLRAGQKPKIDPVTSALDGHEAFAYLWAVRVAHQVWFEAHGSGLTLTHFFPRYADQRDILEDLADTFIATKLSFRALLAAVALHPLFNVKAPADACDPKYAYVLPRVFNPFSKSDPDPTTRNNSPGDGVARWPPAVLIGALDDLLGWPTAVQLPTHTEGAVRDALGVRNNTDRPGFRGTGLFELAAWEARYGACAAPAPPQAQQDGSMTSLIAGSCMGRCNVNDSSYGLCACDPACATRKDCCENFGKACGAFFQLNPAKPPPADWIDALVAAVDPATTLRQVIQTLKDRIHTDGQLSSPEEALLAKLFAVNNLSVKASSTTDLGKRLRLFCGVLLRSPQVTLAGMAVMANSGVDPIVVKGETAQSFCTQWAAMTLPKTASWTCKDGKLLTGATP